MSEPANPVLVFGEELAFRARIARMLKGVGIGAELASTWDRALTLASKQRFHLGIVTPNGALPLMTVQELHRHIPRLLLLGTPREIERLRQLSRYACFLPISRSDEELLERIKTMLPSVEPDSGPAVVSLHDCHIDLKNRLYVCRDGHTIGLTVAETMLLKELAREPGQIRTRDQLRNAVAGRGADRFDRSIDMLIARLRQKIEADPKVPRLIITVPKLGYRLLRKSSGDPANSTAAAGEKRQITVLSCKIAHWAAYTVGRDPEDLSEISQRFRAAAKATVEALGGAIFTQNQGAFFAAFSRSPEHDAECAVRASMDLAQHVTTLQLRGSQQPLQLQMGVASGLVLLGDSQVIGEPVNVAAVLRDSSGPNAPLVDTNTQKLAFNAFSFEPSEPVTSPELPRKIPAFKVSSPEARALNGHFAKGTLIGRERELQQLLRLWDRAKHWHGQVAVITGEPGIGKSRLCQAFLERLSAEPHKIIRYQCSFLLRNSPFHPVISQIGQEAGFTSIDSDITKCEKLRTTLLQRGPLHSDKFSLYTALLAIETNDQRLNETVLKPDRHKMIGRLAEHVAEYAVDIPLVLVITDPRWADSSTLDVINRLVSTIRNKRIFVIVECRPEYAPTWLGLPYVSMLSIDPLTRVESLSLFLRIPGAKELPDSVKTQIIVQSDGVPLFIEEITANALEAASDEPAREGHLPNADTGSTTQVPPTLLAPLTARLDRLGSAKEIIQIAAVSGRECSYELIKQASDCAPEKLNDALARIEQSALMHRKGIIPNAIYTFKHALVREAAYTTLLKTRRRQLHERVANALVIGDAGSRMPDIIAHHYSEAEKHAEALAYWRAAAQEAVRRSAHKEASAHLQQALKELALVDEGRARRKAELEIQTMLGNSLRAVEGWSAEKVKAAYTRALQLCDRDTPNEMIFGPLFGLWAWHFVRPLLAEAEELAERLMSIAASMKEPEYEALGRQALGFTYFAQGRFESANFQLERCIRFCSHRDAAAYGLSGQDPLVHARLYRAMALWFLGYPDQASTLACEALQHAQSSENLFSEAMARAISLRIRQFRGEPAVAFEESEAAMLLCKEHGFRHYFATNLFIRGWARAAQGHIEPGISDLLESLKLQRSNGGLICETYTLGLLGDACIKNGRYRQALGFLQQALRSLETHQSASFYAAEIYRLLGEAHSQLPGHSNEARDFLAKGLELAREQKARSVELKLAITLCELNDHGKEFGSSRALLHELTKSFQEGDDIPDQIRAQSLLERPSAPAGQSTNRNRKRLIAKAAPPTQQKCS